MNAFGDESSLPSKNLGFHSAVQIKYRLFGRGADWHITIIQDRKIYLN
jgi:hypothetical protein